MSDGQGSYGVPTIPAPQFSTFTTIVDPPRPLPAFVAGTVAPSPLPYSTPPIPFTSPSASASESNVDSSKIVENKPNYGIASTQSAVPGASSTAAASSFIPSPTATPSLSNSFSLPSQQTPNKEENASSKTVEEKKVQPLAYAPTKGSYQKKRTFKVIILGDAGVGKTCLSFRFCCGRFPEHTEATIGVDFRERSCVIERELLRVQLWDTAGQERYRQSIVAHYYRNVSAVVFVYDVTNQQSFNSLKLWIAECEKHGLTADGQVPRILIGNKCDLPADSRVSTDSAQIFADHNNMALFETSAKADSEADHVESIFLTLLHKLQQSKPMHVQSADEREAKTQQKLVLKAGEKLEDEEGGMCC